MSQFTAKELLEEAQRLERLASYYKEAAKLLKSSGTVKGDPGITEQTGKNESSIGTHAGPIYGSKKQQIIDYFVKVDNAKKTCPEVRDALEIGYQTVNNVLTSNELFEKDPTTRQYWLKNHIYEERKRVLNPQAD